MSDFRWTLDDFHKAEAAMARHHAAIDAGEPIGELVAAKPGCDRGCAACYFRCLIVTGCVADIRQGLARQEHERRPQWTLCHAGQSYAATAGRA